MPFLDFVSTAISSIKNGQQGIHVQERTLQYTYCLLSVTLGVGPKHETETELGILLYQSNSWDFWLGGCACLGTPRAADKTKAGLCCRSI